MNIQRTLKVPPSNRVGEADNLGLLSDILEPSYRYTPPSLVSVSPDENSALNTSGTTSLAELRAPHIGERVGFREFLD